MSVNQFGNGIASHEVSWLSEPIGQLMSSSVKVLSFAPVPLVVAVVWVVCVVGAVVAVVGTGTCGYW